MNLTPLLTAAITLTLTADGTSISAAPREALTDEIRALIREHKPALLAALQHAAGTGVPWHVRDGANILDMLIVDLRGWVALYPPAAAFAVDLIEQARFAVLVRDMAVLVDVVVAYQELHTMWEDGIWPEVATDTVAIRWCCSKWDTDPATLPMSTGSSKSWYADDEEAV